MSGSDLATSTILIGFPMAMKTYLPNLSLLALPHGPEDGPVVLWDGPEHIRAGPDHLLISIGFPMAKTNSMLGEGRGKERKNLLPCMSTARRTKCN